MDAQTVKYKSIFYPPGGILVMMIVLLELLTFGIALIGLMYYARSEPELFHAARLQLNPTMGAINTFFLLLSGYFMAKSVHSVKQNAINFASKYLKLALSGGFVFIMIKSVEYYNKVEAGLTLNENLFFTFYWLLTGFHLIHVLVGMVILTIIHWDMVKKGQIEIETIESGAAFWHMCDLIWLLLFPCLYLLI